MVDFPGSVSDLHWSPDGSQIAIAVAPTPLIDDHYMNRKIVVLNPADGKEVLRVDIPGKLGKIAWSPRGEFLAFSAGSDRHDPSPARLFLAETKSGKFRQLLQDLDGDITDFGWTDSSTLLFVKHSGTTVALGTISTADGAKAKILPNQPASVFWTISVAKDGKSAATGAQLPDHPTELYQVDLQTGATSRQTNHNPWLAKLRFGKQEVVSYQARDGLRIEGLLIHPVDRKKKERVPLIVVVHGGPESHFSNGWLTWYSIPGQVAAGRGFAVFYPNYRGSTGRGIAFAKADHHDPAGKEFDDIVDGVDHLVSTGLVNKDRVGITGGSYGGFASAWAATYYSERFAASVAFVGVTNLISKVGTTDIFQEIHLVHFRKQVWEDWDFFLKRSPVYHAEGSTTPTLILHGTADTRVDPGQSRELYRHLKIRGKAPVRLVLYPGEGHGNRKGGARLDYSLRMMRWMEHYLKGNGGAAPAYKLDYKGALNVSEEKTAESTEKQR